MPEESADSSEPVNEPAKKPTKKPKNRRDNVLFWQSWLKEAIDNESAKRHRKISDCAWDEYENAKSEVINTSDGDIPRCYPAYYTNCKYFEPALYAKVPVINTRRRFGIDDPLALTQVLIIDRIGEWLLEEMSFNESMHMARDNTIHTDKAAIQAFIEECPAEEYEEEQLAPLKKPKKKIVFRSVAHDEILHTPDANCQSKIKELAFLCHATEDEGKERFPEIEDLPLRDKKSSVEDGDKGYDPEKKLKESISERFISFFEIYDLTTNMVYWVSLDYPDGFLDKKPLREVSKLRKKFPLTSFVINNQPRKHLFPTPVYKQLEPTIKRLHKQYTQIMDWIDAAVPQTLVLTDDKDVVELLENPTGGRFVQAKNHRDLLEKGGANTLLQDVPVDGLVAAVQQLIALDDVLLMKFDQWFGIPDIVKGISEGEKTKAEVELQTGAVSDRFRYLKKQIERLAVEALEMGIDLVLDHFDPIEIAKICGWEFMERGEVDPQTGQIIAPGHYERFPIALERLKSDDERLCRLDIETDSTSYTNEVKEIQKRRQIYDTVLQGLSTIGGMKNQEFMKPVSRIFLSLVDAVGGSILDEDSIKQAIEEIEQIRLQPEPQQPDMTHLKVQAQMQANDIKAQKDQMDNIAKHRDLDRKEYETGIKEREIAFNQQLDAMQSQMDRTLTELEVQRVQIEQFKAKTAADESQLEEMRLALDQINVDRDRSMLGLEEESEKATSAKAPEPTIVIVDAKDNSSRRVATVTERDLNGAIKQLMFEPVNNQ